MMEESSTVKLPLLNADELLRAELKKGQRIQVRYRYQGESRSLYVTVFAVIDMPPYEYKGCQMGPIRIVYCGDRIGDPTQPWWFFVESTVELYISRHTRAISFYLVERDGQAVFKILDDRQRRLRQHLDGA